MKLLRLFLRYVADFILANITIARQVLSPRLDLHPEIVEIETKVKSPLEVLALSNMVSFTPGTLVLEIDPEEESLLMHVLDNAEEQAESVHEHLEEPLLEITRKQKSSES